MMCPLIYYCAWNKADDGKLQAESDSGEFWVLFGGFAPIGKKVFTEDDLVLETAPVKIYRWLNILLVGLIYLKLSSIVFLWI